MNKKQALQWLLVLGRDWVHENEVYKYFAANKVTNFYHERFIDVKPIGLSTKGQAKLLPKALALLEEV
jgi:hypothetical protein